MVYMRAVVHTSLLTEANIQVTGLKGLRHGKGKIIYSSNGSEYDGEWKNGFKNGIGTYVYINGDIYKGKLEKWKNAW